MDKEQAKQKIILLAEDDVFIGDIFETKIASLGFNVIKATDGTKVIEKLEEGVVPNLMLLDLRMPTLDGFGVLEKINENEEWKKIPIVMLTNLSQESDVVKCKSMGAKDFIIKSLFTPSEVLAKVEKYIN